MFIKLRHLRSQRATTIVEMIITLTIFATVAMMAVTTLSNTLKATKRIQAQIFVYTEAQAIMDVLGRYVERNTIDYEAYFDRNVWDTSAAWATEEYGVYGQRFYDPGDNGPDDGPYNFTGYYGIYCSDGTSTWPDDCSTELPDYAQGDTDDGVHPFIDIADYSSAFSTSDDQSMNAFCNKRNAGACERISYAVTDELILINAAGDERFVFLKELDSDLDSRMSMIELWATDDDGDGIPETWECASDYDCSDPLTDLTDGDNEDNDSFLPLTPKTLDISEFYVIVAPVEDPYKAFGEQEVQIQPHVTLVMTVTLSEDYGASIMGDPPTITIQRTITTGVYSEVTSYE